MDKSVKIVSIKNPSQIKPEEWENIIKPISVFIINSWGDYKFEKISKHYKSLDEVILGKIDEEIVMVTGYNWISLEKESIKKNILRIGLTVVNSNHRFRNKGLMSTIITSIIIKEYLKKKLRPFWIVLRTSDSRVYGSIYKRLNSVFPSVPYTKPSLVIEKIAKRAAEVISPEYEFDKNTFAIRGAFKNYPSLLNANLKADKYHDEVVVRAMDSWLDYQNGDALIVVSRMDFKVILKFLLRKIAKAFTK